MRQRWIPTLLGLAVALLGIQFVSTASAQESGDVIRFVVPAGTSVTGGPTGDMLIYTGQSSALTDAGDCVLDGQPRPIQSALLVDPASAQRATHVMVITLDTNLQPQTTEVPPGTRVTNLTAGIPPQCSIGGQSQDKYVGVVN